MKNLLQLPPCGRIQCLLAAALLASSGVAGVVFESLPAGGDVIGMGQAYGISTDGSTIVGASWSISKWEGQSFRWTPGGGVQFLEPALPLASRAGGTSSAGSVVGGRRFSDYPQAFCWSNGTLKPMVANRSSAVFDVSKDGKTVVGSNPVDKTIAPVATKWTISAAGTSAAVSLGDLAGGVAESEAKRISGDGTTIVGWGTSGSGVSAFRIVGTGTMAALGDLPGGKYFSEATGVSTDGSVVVGRSHSTKGPEAFRWTSAGMVGLGDLPGGPFCSEATGVSGDGTIVIGTSASAVETDLFLWTAATGMRSLVALCRAAHIDLNGWRFPYSRPVISEDGNVASGDALSPQMDQVVWRLEGVRELVAQAPTLFWQGDGVANTWDLATTASWTDGAAPTAFADGQRVAFDDFGSNAPAVALTGILAPSAVVVDSTLDYTFGGSGSLEGTLSLAKNGTGTLTLAGTCRSSGGTTVNAGTLAVAGTLEDTGSLGIVVMPGATLHLAGGTIRANVRIHPGGFLTGVGTIIGNLTNEGSVTAATGGVLAMDGVILNQGTMQLTGGTTLDMHGSFINDGVVDVITGAFHPPATFVNNGVLLDSSSVRVASLAKTGTTVRLGIESVAGHSYQLERSLSLADGTWAPLGDPQQGTGGVLTFSDDAAVGRCGFYRIVVR